MILDEVFAEFVAAHDHIDLSDFDMATEVIPMVAEWCEGRSAALEAEEQNRRQGRLVRSGRDGRGKIRLVVKGNRS